MILHNFPDAFETPRTEKINDLPQIRGKVLASHFLNIHWWNQTISTTFFTLFSKLGYVISQNLTRYIPTKKKKKKRNTQTLGEDKPIF